MHKGGQIMTEKFVAIIFFVGAIIAGYIACNELVWLRKHKRFDLNQTKEEIEDFCLLRQMKRLAVIICFLIRAIFLLIAYFLSN